MTIHLTAPLKTAYVSTNSLSSAKNYDEFQSDDEIRDLLQQNPLSVLSVTMPHCQKESSETNPYSPASLTLARQTLIHLINKGIYEKKDDLYYIYQIIPKERPARPQTGLGCMVLTSEIRDENNPDGKIIRNEAIFEHKASGRAELIEKTESMIGTVNLCTQDADHSLERRLVSLAGGPAAVSMTDEKGDEHRIILIEDSSVKDELTRLTDGRELYVADGNHRSKAAQMKGYERFLTVIFPVESMNIDPYNRLFKDLGRKEDEILELFKEKNFSVTEIDRHQLTDGGFHASRTHEIGLCTGGDWYLVVPRDVDESDPRGSIDAQIIEDRIVKGGFGLDPADKRIAYVGGDYGPSWLHREVVSGRGDFALSMPPMTMEEFVKINEARQFLPRKTTWFTPKLRSGFVIAGL